MFLFERFKFYSGLFVEKAKHEVLISFVSLFAMIGLFIAVCWGLLGAECKYLAVAAIMAWGPGDGMAAIIGIRFGKRKLTGKWIEGTKSVEGTVAMGVTSFLCVTVTLLLMTDIAWWNIVVGALLIAVASAFTEMFTQKGWDTVTVPVVALAIMLVMR